MTADDRLDAIEARANAATEGPWHRGGQGGASIILSPEVYVAQTSGLRWAANADFIAHARQDVPALVSALRAVLALHERTHSCGVAWYAESPDKAPLGARLDRCPTVTAITAALIPGGTDETEG